MSVHLCPHQGALEVCSDPNGACSAPVLAPCLHPAHAKLWLAKLSLLKNGGLGGNSKTDIQVFKDFENVEGYIHDIFFKKNLSEEYTMKGTFPSSPAPQASRNIHNGLCISRKKFLCLLVYMHIPVC